MYRGDGPALVDARHLALRDHQPRRLLHLVAAAQLDEVPPRSGAGLLALAENRLDDAAREFGRLAREIPGQANYAPVALHNLAITLLLKGDLDGAEAELARVERWAHLAWSSGIRALCAVSFVELYTLKGDLPRARSWLADARSRQQGGQFLGLGGRLALVTTEALLLCREGKAHEASALLDGNWALLEAQTTAKALRRSWLLQAWARRRARVRRARADLKQLRPARAGEFASLAKAWPELRRLSGGTRAREPLRGR